MLKQSAQKFIEMHDLINSLFDHRNSTTSQKISTMDEMSTSFDGDTKDHFRAALTQVLREERNKQVRIEAISLLACYFDWDDIEWTFWLHGKRRPEDAKNLAVYGHYAKNKSAHGLDATTLNAAVIAYKDARGLYAQAVEV